MIGALSLHHDVGSTVRCQAVSEGLSDPLIPCNRHSHILCGVFSGGCAPTQNVPFCRRHCPILLPSAMQGTHSLIEHFKMLKMSKMDHTMRALLLLLKQRLFRNQVLIQSVIDRLKQRLSVLTAEHPVPSNRDCPDTVGERQSAESAAADSTVDAAAPFLDFDAKNEYKMAIATAFSSLIASTQSVDGGDSGGAGDDDGIPAIEALPNYTESAVNALHQITDCALPQRAQFAVSPPPSGDEQAVVELVSFSKFLSEESSRIFNGGKGGDTLNALGRSQETPESLRLQQTLREIDQRFLREEIPRILNIDIERIGSEEEGDGDSDGGHGMEVDSEPEMNGDHKEDPVATKDTEGAAADRELNNDIARKIKFCPLCGRTRGKHWSISSWVKHLKCPHSRKCPHCPFATTKLEYYEQHIRETHLTEKHEDGGSQ